LVQAVNVAGASAVPATKKQHPLFAGAIKDVKQQAAQLPLSQKGQPKEIGNDLQDNHEAASNSLTADNNSPPPPCASLQTQADSSPTLTSSDLDMVTRAEKNYLTDEVQPSPHDSHKAYNSPLAFANNQAKSTGSIEVPQEHHGAAADSLTADIYSSMGHVTKDAAPPQPAQIDLLRPQESYSNTGQYQPLKDMAQGLRVSAPFTCFCCV